MHKLLLVNMPFSDLALPSIALTQLKSIVEKKFRDRMSAEVIYLNHDFAKYLGLQFYNYLTESLDSLNTGLGDWFFRQDAFPELPNNTEEYFRRYFPARTPESEKLKDWVIQRRAGLDSFVDQMIKTYGLDSADIVGFTSMFMQNAACFAMARKLKALNPSLLTVIGGANCEFPMGGIIAERVDCIDFVFSGPALKSFPEFLERYLNGSGLSSHNPIRGVFTKGCVPKERGPQTIGDELSIDDVVELDYEVFLRTLDYNFPNGEIKPVLPFETSRGCWWGERAHCTFCGLNGVSMGYRAMSPDRAIEQFNKFFRYSGRVSKLSAVDNILPKSYLKDVLPYLETPPDMEIFYEVKADLSEEDISTLSLARVNRIQPGIESLATSTLKLMKKGTTVFQNLALLKRCALYGIQPVWNLLVGFPGETEAVYKRYMETLPLVFHLPPPSGVYPVRFDRFSPYHDRAQDYGLDLHPLDFYSLIYPFNAADFNDFAYYFVDRNIQAEYFITVAQWLGKLRSQVARWQEIWNRPKNAPPRLYFRAGSTTVCDSRSGSVMEREVGETGKMILEHLSRPTRVEDLAKTFAASYGVDISADITLLREYGLVFEEGDRVFSLLLEAEYGNRGKRAVHSHLAQEDKRASHSSA
jgi:ribosomal peptide maturation radical SAM protein 1